MVVYSCNICNFETNQLYNFNRHKNTKNHKEKEHIAMNSPNVNETSPTTECLYCHTFHEKTHIARHLKRCMVKQSTESKLEELERKNQELSNKLNVKENDLRKHQNYIKETIKEKDNYIKEKDDTIKRKDLILENLIKLHKYDKIPAQELLNTFAPNAPNLLEFKDFDKFKTNRGNDKMDHVEIAIHYETSGELSKYISEMLVDEYKKDKKYEQSLHVTDEQRNNCQIRLNDSWNIDKKGQITTGMLIDPILKDLQDKLVQYIETTGLQSEEYLKKTDLISKKTAELMIEKIATCNRILKKVDNGTLKISVMAHLREHFMFDRDKIIVDSVNDNKQQLQDKQKKKKKKKYKKKISEVVMRMPQTKRGVWISDIVSDYSKKMDKTYNDIINNIVQVNAELSIIHTDGLIAKAKMERPELFEEHD